jgi:hypothetical protein
MTTYPEVETCTRRVILERRVPRNCIAFFFFLERLVEGVENDPIPYTN